MSSPGNISTSVVPTFSLAVDDILLTPFNPVSFSSNFKQIDSSTLSGDAPGYITLMETISKLISGKTSIFILGKVITPATIINNISILAATVLLTNQRIILSIIFSSKRLSAFHQLVRSILLIGFHLHYLDQRLSKLVPVHI